MLKSNRTKTKKPRKIYLDYASGALSSSPNPSAIHALGVSAKKKLEESRAQVARLLEALPDEIIFTSGSTESNNLAILGLVNEFHQTHKKQIPHIVTTNIEHASVLEVCRYLERNKLAEVSYVPVGEDGIVKPESIKKVLKKNTVLVSVIYANNEIGTISPIVDIAKIIRHFNKVNSTKIYFHTDATQAVNYLSVNVLKLGVDMMSFNSSKIYGPRGIGVLYKKRGVSISPIMFGGDQEMGLRPGTENEILAEALAKALNQVQDIKEIENKRLTALRDYFFKELKKIDNNIIINGDSKDRLPNNINITVKNIPSDLLVLELSARGIMASEKSACKSGDGKASHVLRAINPNLKEEDGSVRFSLGRETTKKDIDFTLVSLKKILNKLKGWYN